MAFDASGTDRNAYITVDEYLSYWNDRKDTTALQAERPEIERAILFASEYIDGRYIDRWIGEHPGSNSQIRAWPRNNAEDSEGRIWTGVPQFLKDASARLARDLIGTFPETTEKRGGQVTREWLDGVGGREYAEHAPAGTTYPYLDTMLAPLLKRRGASRRVRRV